MTSFILIIFIVYCIVMVRFSIGFYNKIWNPIALFCIMMMAGVILSYANVTSVGVYEYERQNGMVLLLSGTVLFSLSFIIAQIGLLKSNTINLDYEYNERAVSNLTTLSLILGLASALISTYIVLQISGDINRVFLESTAVRNAYLKRSTSGLITYSLLFININHLCLFCIYPMALKLKCPFIKVKLAIEFLASLWLSIVTMSKESFIFFCLIYISAYVVQLAGKEDEIKFVRKYGIYFIIMIIALLVVVSFQRNYTEGRYDSYADAVIGTISIYIGVPIDGFCKITNLPSQMLMGSQCFRPMINILSQLGIFDKVSAIQGALRDNSTNVFTMFGNMYNDYGNNGVYLLSIFFGFFLGALYHTNATNRLSSSVSNSIILATMFLAFYDFVLMQTVYPLTIFYSFILEYILKNKIYLHT